jgi:hypothetical protein
MLSGMLLMEHSSRVFVPDVVYFRDEDSRPLGAIDVKVPLGRMINEPSEEQIRKLLEETSRPEYVERLLSISKSIVRINRNWNPLTYEYANQAGITQAIVEHKVPRRLGGISLGAKWNFLRIHNFEPAIELPEVGPEPPSIEIISASQ